MRQERAEATYALGGEIVSEDQAKAHVRRCWRRRLALRCTHIQVNVRMAGWTVDGPSSDRVQFPS